MIKVDWLDKVWERFDPKFEPRTVSGSETVRLAKPRQAKILLIDDDEIFGAILK